MFVLFFSHFLGPMNWLKCHFRAQMKGHSGNISQSVLGEGVDGNYSPQMDFWIEWVREWNGCANALTELRRLAWKLLRLTAPPNGRVPPLSPLPDFPRHFPDFSPTFLWLSPDLFLLQALQFVRTGSQLNLDAETEPQFEFVLPFGVVMTPPRHPHPYPHPYPAWSRHVLFVCLSISNSDSISILARVSGLDQHLR